MGKNLAIKGHSTRGKEVIELLEMMGGVNADLHKGNFPDEWKSSYYIYGDNTVQFARDEFLLKLNFVIFTLEEFLEKYPFKVGDKVIDKADGCPGVVCEMKWDDDVSDIKYCVAFGNGIDFGWFANDSIEFCKENENLGETSVKDRDDILFDGIIWHLRNSVNNGKQNLSGGECEDYFREVVKKNNENKMKGVLAELLEHIKTTPKEELEKEFNELEEWSHVGPTVEEFMDFCNKVNKKPKYPTTYEDCCEVLGIEEDLRFVYEDIDSNHINPACISNYRMRRLDLYHNFEKLLICRDAYWKLANDWKPDWNNGEQKKYCIYYGASIIQKGVWSNYNSILAFPTEEMRDAFYENFKDLIEQCKELL